MRAARILEVELDAGGRRRRSPRRSRGTPRVANRLLKRARDYAEVRGDGTVTAEVAQAALELLEVDELGLDRLDREILRAICEQLRAAGRSASRRSRSRSARSATRSRTSTSPTCCSSACSSARRAGGSRPRTPTRTSSSRRRAVGAGAVLSDARRRAAASPGSACRLSASMPHPFICPNCGERSLASDRYEAFRREERGCANCGFSFLFELLDDYYPAPDAAFFVADREGRVIGCGRGSFELTGYEEEEVVGQPLARGARPELRERRGPHRDRARVGGARARQAGDAAHRGRPARRARPPTSSRPTTTTAACCSCSRRRAERPMTPAMSDRARHIFVLAVRHRAGAGVAAGRRRHPGRRQGEEDAPRPRPQGRHRADLPGAHDVRQAGRPGARSPNAINIMRSRSQHARRQRADDHAYGATRSTSQLPDVKNAARGREGGRRRPASSTSTTGRRA